MNRTPAQETALTAFVEAATADEDYGYPQGAVLVAADDPEGAAPILWGYLREGRPTILVKENRAQMMIAPVRLNAYRRFSDRLRRRIPVEVAYRAYPAPPHPGPALRAEIKRDALVSEHFSPACV